MIWLSCESCRDTTDDDATGVGLKVYNSNAFMEKVFNLHDLCVRWRLWNGPFERAHDVRVWWGFYCIANLINVKLQSIHCTNTAAVLSSTNKLTTQIIVLTVNKIIICRKQKWNVVGLLLGCFLLNSSIVLIHFNS